ncbi:polysaccharide biosynthesis tyrosine autokinase [Vibrio fluvialis]|uniref:polysaccharide biosynthesis tyrosine autokinase n=1 Tax=Vibrio fluvialis TaxID=676 RepID=UPI001558EE75|nr:polysaccharide biosynthesis tyrosine autokinase [Vibrio fluvialis]MBY8039697.1 polysaccharide biosynthesis tyrosine autokinase [Vibrio fluvialis]
MTSKKSTALIQSDSDIDLVKLFGALVDDKWKIISITIVFFSVGLLYALLSTPIYKSDALIQIENKSSGVSAMVGDMGDIFSSEASSSTEIEIIKSRMILGATVDKFNLTTAASYDYFPIFGKGISRLLGERKNISISRFSLDDDSAKIPSYLIKVTSADKGEYKLIEDGKILLSSRVGQIASNGNVTILVSEITAKDNDEFNIVKKSRLDAIAALSSVLRVEEKGKGTGIVELSFTGENKYLVRSILDDISKNYFLQNVERKSEEAEKSLTFLKEHLPEIKIKLDNAEDQLNQFRQENESVDLGLEAKSTLDIMVKLESQLNGLTFRESEISRKYTKDHPNYKALLDKRKILLEEKEKLNKRIEKLPKTQREILRLNRDVQLNQQIYIQLLNKVQELNIIKASTVGNIRIIDEAEIYSRPIKPNKLIIVIVATVIGFIIAIMFTLAKSLLHKGIETPDQIEEVGLSVYASVPKSNLQKELENKFKSKKEPVLLAQSNPADLSIEALRGLRTSLHFAMMEAKNNVLMFSGPAPGIGKSFVSTNFAAVAAKTGQKVLLIDADMRKGYLQQCFGVEWDNGLSDILSGKLSIEDGIKSTGIENLNIITRGQVPPNPSELLMHPRFSELVEWANDNYDLVIIDTPPVLAVTDPSIVGAIAGTTLMVARFGLNTVKEIDVARSRFAQSGIDVKGVILNAVEKKASNAYGYGYYSYSYEADK